MTALKDDMATQVQVKQLQVENLNQMKTLHHQAELQLKGSFDVFVRQVQEMLQTQKQNYEQRITQLESRLTTEQTKLMHQLLVEHKSNLTKFEQQKADFLTSVQKNMQLMDSLVSEYAAKTKEQITKQLNE